MTRILALLAVSAAAITFAPDRVGAEEDAEVVARARTYFDAGKQAYAAGRFKVAATAFEESYELSPRPAILFSAAQAYRRQYFIDKQRRYLERALELYRRYLEDVPQGGRREDAANHLATLEPLWMERSLDGPADFEPTVTQLMVGSKVEGARASIDGGELVDVPAIEEVSPGEHLVRVEAPGHYPVETTAVAVEGRLIPLQVPLSPIPATLTVRAPSGAHVAIDGRTATAEKVELAAGKHYVTVTRRGRRPFAREVVLDNAEHLPIDVAMPTTRQRRASYWLFGGAGAIAVAGGVTALLALRSQSDADDIRAKRDVQMIPLTTDERDEHNALLDRRDRLRTTSYVLFGTAAAVGTTAALFYWLDHERPETPDDGGRFVPLVSGEGLGAAYIGRFD
jgi:hypothetical protein